MTEIEELRALEEIRLLRARLSRFVDLHDWEAWRALMTDDYRLETEHGTQQGRDEIVAFVSSALGSASSVHQVFGPDITLTGPTTATGTCGYEDRVVLATDDGPILLHGYGYLRDEYARTGGAWCIRSTVETRLQSNEP